MSQRRRQGGAAVVAQQQKQRQPQQLVLQPVHRYAFVQHLMRHGCLPETEAKVNFQKITGSTDGAEISELQYMLRGLAAGMAILTTSLMQVTCTSSWCRT